MRCFFLIQLDAGILFDGISLVSQLMVKNNKEGAGLASYTPADVLRANVIQPPYILSLYTSLSTTLLTKWPGSPKHCFSHLDGPPIAF